jgi:putative transposase
MKTVAEAIGVSRSNLAERRQERPQKRIGRPPLPDEELVAQIKAVIGELPTYGYRRVHAILKRQALAAGLKPLNHKRIYRAMKVHGLLLDRHAGGIERRHDGRIAVDERNRRWCSDGFEIGCDNGERVRVAFALDCCDREAMSFLATTRGISGDDVRDLMVAAVEHRFGRVNRLPVTIEWLSDNGSCYIAGDTRSFARDIGLEPRTTPIESPQSNGMAEAFVRTIKRDYVRVSSRANAESVMCQLPSWIAHYNEVHPHKALGYRSPREFIAAHEDPDRVRSFGGFGASYPTSRGAHTPRTVTDVHAGLNLVKPRLSDDHRESAMAQPAPIIIALNAALPFLSILFLIMMLRSSA